MLVTPSAQEEARRQGLVESEAKVENAQLKSEQVASSDKAQQLQKVGRWGGMY